MPEINCSPVVSLMSILTVGSSLPNCLKTSINFGKSLVFLASIAIVTTGSEIWSIGSNSSILFSAEHNVSPAVASLMPVKYAMFPTGTFPVSMVSAPKNIPICCIRAFCLDPTR